LDWALIVILHRLWLALWFSGFLIIGASTGAAAMPSSGGADAAALPAPARDGATRLAQAPSDPSAPAPTPSAQAPVDEPIGNVVTLTGSATVTRNHVATPLKLKDDIFLNDVVQTAAASKLGVTFNDATTFSLSASSSITIDNYVYEDGGKDNAGIFDIGRGTVAFVAAAIAKTGDMKITTPTATMGIRGTTGVVEVPEDAAAANPRNVAIKLYPDPDGHIGRIEVNDRAGTRLGALTLGASGFTIQPGVGGGRVIAAPLAISLQQARRDQGFVRELHAAQRTGRQIVTQQRALRRANQIRNNQVRPQIRPRPNGLPGQPGQPPLPANPNRQGQQQPNPPQRAGQSQAPGQRPGQAPRGAQPQRPGQPGQPADHPQRQGAQPETPRQQGLPQQQVLPRQPPAPVQQQLRPQQPRLQRLGEPNRPALARPRAAPTPKKKRPGEPPPR
jgi:FecR protein